MPKKTATGGGETTATASSEAKAAADTAADDITFEQALSRLESIVEQLERGEETLEGSLTLFEEGTRLSRILKLKLDEAQGRIEKLTAGRGVPGLEPFAQEEEGED